MSLWSKFVNNKVARRIAVLALICLCLWFVRSMMSVILFTFIFTFINLRLTETLHKYLKLPEKLSLVIIYFLAIGGIYLAITTYLPQIVVQTDKLVRAMITYYQNPPHSDNIIIKQISNYLSSSEIVTQMKKGLTVVMSYLSSVGAVSFSFVMGLLLSFFFVLEKEQTYSFSRTFLHGPLGWMFEDIYFYGKKFGNTFGVVLETQLFIAICNTVITGVALAFMRLPQLFALIVLIFFMSLVPVAGVIISAIPLSFVAYYVGGIRYVIYVIILLCVVHAFEAYFLNPKFMSARTELPIFYTFVVLLASEELMGVWGLIVGIPIFTFALDMLGVKSIGRSDKQTKKDQATAEKD